MKAVAWIVATAFAVFFFADGRYFKVEAAGNTHQTLLKRMVEIDKKRVISELRQLSAKEKTVGLEVWEKLRKEDLQLQLKELTQ